MIIILSAVLDHINELSSAYEPNAWSDRDCCSHIDTMHEIVSVLNNAAEAYVPEHRKKFFKCWWDEELRLLKAASAVDANKLWKAAGKPRHGSVYMRAS